MGITAVSAQLDGDPTAQNGHWEKGPGYELFAVMKKKLGKKKVIAEDLGFLTPSVIRLVKKTGYPGMKILQDAPTTVRSPRSSPAGSLPHRWDDLPCLTGTASDSPRYLHCQMLHRSGYPR